MIRAWFEAVDEECHCKKIVPKSASQTPERSKKQSARQTRGLTFRSSFTKKGSQLQYINDSKGSEDEMNLNKDDNTFLIINIEIKYPISCSN